MAEDKKVVESSELKFTEDELQSLQGLQEGYQQKQAILGQLDPQTGVFTPAPAPDPSVNK